MLVVRLSKQADLFFKYDILFGSDSYMKLQINYHSETSLLRVHGV